jgi:hypothetical protein
MAAYVNWYIKTPEDNKARYSFPIISPVILTRRGRLSKMRLYLPGVIDPVSDSVPVISVGTLTSLNGHEKREAKVLCTYPVGIIFSGSFQASHR